MKEKDKNYLLRANQFHGGKYDYSLVTGNLTVRKKIPIICKEHGEFTQVLRAHLNGSGCPKCGYEGRVYESRLDKSDYIARAKGVHPSASYDYSLIKSGVKYKEKVEIICPSHGVFTQLFADHLNGSGCPKCGNIARGDAQRRGWLSLLEQAKQIHNDKYGYTVDTANLKLRDKITIRCPDHGLFTQELNHHIYSESGCPVCARNNVSKAEDSLAQLISSYTDKEVCRQDRVLVPGLDLDITIPELNLAFEYNGYYYHASEGKAIKSRKHRLHHQERWEACRQAGVKLITVQEFNGLKHYDPLIANLLGKSTIHYARKLEIAPVDKATAHQFYLTNHIEGSTRLGRNHHHKGLLFNGELIMCASWTNTYVTRVSTLLGMRVVGGLSRLLKHVPTGCIMFTTNDTGSPSQLPYFTKEPYKNPRYYWVKHNQILPRRSAQKARIAKRFGISVEGKTEVELMVSLGFFKVYDSGLSKFVRQ